MTERWLSVPGHEGAYEVSDHGRVRSLPRLAGNVRPRRRPGQHLAGRPTLGGYLRVQMAGQDKYIHRLVLEAFVAPCPDGMEACHNDGDRTNNHISNLRWDTRLGNCQDIIAHGTHANLQKTHCPEGHEYDGVANGWKSTLTGQRKKRVCLTCRRLRYHRRKASV